MSEALGLSIGSANLVATRAGGVPVSRRSVLTLFDRRTNVVGLPDQSPNQNEAGMVIRGFVERVGDRVPLVAADGARYLSATLTVEALDAMAGMVGHGSPIAIAFPAYWSDGQIAALRNECRAKPSLAPNGTAPLLVSDAEAAATSLYAKPGFPTKGVVLLCDFGASGTSTSLVARGGNFQQIGESVRHTLSGNEIDQLLANHLHARARNARTVGLSDAIRTGHEGLSSRDCRRVKEQLSAVAVATIAVGPDTDMRLSRNDFEQLLGHSVSQFITSVEETLQRNGIPLASLSAVATVGGGAVIPFLTTRLSERLRVPIFSPSQPAFAAALGAAKLAGQQPSASVRRVPGPITPPRMPTAPPRMPIVPPTMPTAPPTMPTAPPTMPGTPPRLPGAPPTRASTPPRLPCVPPTTGGTPPTMAASAPSAAGASHTETAPTAFTGDDGGSAPHALAWSEDAGSGKDPVPFVGPDYNDDDFEEAPEGGEDPAHRGKRPWYKRSSLILTIVGAGAAVLAAAGLALSLGQGKTSTTDTTTPSPSQTSETAPAPTPSDTPTTTTTEVPESSAEEPVTTTYNPPPPPRSQPPRTTQPATTTAPTRTKSPSPQTSPPPPTTTHHFPFPPPFAPPTPKH